MISLKSADMSVATFRGKLSLKASVSVFQILTKSEKHIYL